MQNDISSSHIRNPQQMTSARLFCFVHQKQLAYSFCYCCFNCTVLRALCFPLRFGAIYSAYTAMYCFISAHCVSGRCVFYSITQARAHRAYVLFVVLHHLHAHSPSSVKFNQFYTSAGRTTTIIALINQDLVACLNIRVIYSNRSKIVIYSSRSIKCTFQTQQKPSLIEYCLFPLDESNKKCKYSWNSTQTAKKVKIICYACVSLSQNVANNIRRKKRIFQYFCHRKKNFIIK